IGLAGGGDPDNRRLMPWDDSTLNEHQKTLRTAVMDLTKIRAENKSLSRGFRKTLSADEHTWVYEMSGCAESSGAVLVAINRSDSERQLAIPAGSYVDLINQSTVSGGVLTLGARSFVVLGQ
ncbi:Beta-galactosidase C-terminal domain, partial [Myxococcota bacterium]|nr:Beta-galactosidase C-terminal domain [Myxococcota bacterium]